jgi:hypothetical protein
MPPLCALSLLSLPGDAALIRCNRSDDAGQSAAPVQLIMTRACVQALAAAIQTLACANWVLSAAITAATVGTWPGPPKLLTGPGPVMPAKPGWWSQ